jgi:hypothetical protein
MIELTADERALLLAWPDGSDTYDELHLAQLLNWTHARVRETMMSLQEKGLARLDVPAHNN